MLRVKLYMSLFGFIHSWRINSTALMLNSLLEAALERCWGAEWWQLLLVNVHRWFLYQRQSFGKQGFYQNQLVARRKRPFHWKGILLLLFVRAWELSRSAFPCKPTIELPRNPPFSTETFSRESFDTKYAQANLTDLLTDWQVVIQSVFSVSQEREFE